MLIVYEWVMIYSNKFEYDYKIVGSHFKMVDGGGKKIFHKHLKKIDI